MRLRDRSSCLLVIASAITAACGGGSYAYVPEGATARPDGRPVSRIAIPPERPRGEVRVESMGVTRLEARGARDIDAIHVRMTVGNDSDDRTWAVDTREQLLEIRGEGRSQPIFVNSDRDSIPIIQIARREQRVLDLYYPLPSTMSEADDLPGFDLLWQVDTGDRPVAQRTAFTRVSTEPRPTYHVATVFHAGWGPYWWYDPFYTRNVFIHHRPILIRDPGRVVVVRQPRGHFMIRDRR